MARRKLTSAEEAQLIADAEAARDDPDVIPSRTDVRAAAEATTVLSVRLPASKLRQLRAVAAARGESLSELLQSAVDALIASPQPRIQVSNSLQRAAFVGVASFTLPTSGVQIAEGGPDTHGEAFTA